MKIRRALIAFSAGVPLAVLAQVSAIREEICLGVYVDGSCTRPASNVTVNFQFSGKDAGRPGALFIGARATSGTPGSTSNINSDTQGMWLYTTAGWVPFNGSSYTPVEAFSSLPGSRSYRVIEAKNLCEFAGNRNMELWAGYGVLQPDKEQQVNSYYAVKTTNIPVEHLRAVFTYNDMQASNKYWNVLSLANCSNGAN